MPCAALMSRVQHQMYSSPAPRAERSHRGERAYLIFGGGQGAAHNCILIIGSHIASKASRRCFVAWASNKSRTQWKTSPRVA
jgi:hypothetical protein